MTRQKTKLTKESEEYLEAIYKLQEKEGVARTSEIAKQLNVALGSVTNTIESLEKRGLVAHEPYRGIRLTEKGLKEALKVIRKHRLAERLLADDLKMDWSEVHEAACSLEHALTEEILSYVERTLGYPKRCPHGNPIPSKDGKIEEEQFQLLTSLKPEEKAEIAKITRESREKLGILANYGLKPGTKICLLNKNIRKGFLELQVRKLTFKLDIETASTIWIRRE